MSFNREVQDHYYPPPIVTLAQAGACTWSARNRDQLFLEPHAIVLKRSARNAVPAFPQIERDSPEMYIVIKNTKSWPPYNNDFWWGKWND